MAGTLCCGRLLICYPDMRKGTIWQNPYELLRDPATYINTTWTRLLIHVDFNSSSSRAVNVK